MSVLWITLMYLLMITNSDAHSQEITEMPLIIPDPTVLRGLGWLEKQRNPNYGFQEHTAEAVLTFQLANVSTWYNTENLFSILVVQQMDIEILLRLFRRHALLPSPKDFALYSLALNALCRDPRQFYGYDLITDINHQEMLLDSEFAMSSLAVCTSGTHVRKRQIRRLLDIAEKNNDVNVETISKVVLALNCIVHDHKNRNLNHYLIHPTKKLGKLQKDNGSFGDLISSAWAIQALKSTDPGARHWNKTNALHFIRQQQNADGSFGKEEVTYATILVLLVLGPKSLANIKDTGCRSEKTDDWLGASMAHMSAFSNASLGNSSTNMNVTFFHENKTMNAIDMSKLKENSDDIVTVSYTLWVGSNVTETYNINITTDNNNTFYNVMQLAAEKDDHFSFLSTEWPNGHYVHTLAGYKEEPMSYHYWLLYKLPMFPDLSSPPPNQFVAPVGVDELLIEDGDHFLFWYKKL